MHEKVDSLESELAAEREKVDMLGFASREFVEANNTLEASNTALHEALEKVRIENAGLGRFSVIEQALAEAKHE